MPEALQAFLNWLSAGGSVAEYTDIVADNGMIIGQGFAEQLIGGNGAATTATQLVEIEGSAATAAGVGVMAVEFPAAVAAIAPALGIIAGVGLYDLAPDFWTDVSQQLIEAGQTIGGSVIGFVNELGETAFSHDTVEIIKNALINAGLYDDSISANPDFDTSNLQVGSDIILPEPTLTNAEYASFIENSLNSYSFDPIAIQSAVAAINNLSENTPLVCAISITINSAGANAIGFSVSLLPSTNTVVEISSDDVRLSSTGQTIYSYGSSLGLTSVINTKSIIASWALTSTALVTIINNVTGILNPSGNIQEGSIVPALDTPFEQTYPTWHPWDVPDEDAYPVSLPYPGITQPGAQTGENTGEIAIGGLIDLLYDLAVNDNVIPDEAEADTDISVPIESPVEEVIEAEDDPVAPISPIVPVAPVIDLPTLETTRADRMFTVYNPTDGQINNLGGFLWTNSIMEQIKKMWQDPMDAIIAFHKVYAAPTTGSTAHIVLGYIDSEVSANVVTSQFTDVDCGSVVISERLHNATDYSPFSKAMIYLPFIGIVDIDINDIMNSTVNVKYKVDMYTGTCLAMIYCQRTTDMPTAQLLYTFSGNASQQLPLTGTNFNGAVSALLGLAGAAISVPSGGAGVAIGAVGAAHSLTQEMVHMQRSGGLSANAGIMGPRKPYIILERQNCQDANGYYSYYGYPANKTVYLSNCSGYVRVKSINLKSTATAEEKSEIVTMLKDGVII